MTTFLVEIQVLEAMSNRGGIRYLAMLPPEPAESELYMSQACDTPEEALRDLFDRLVNLPYNRKPDLLSEEIGGGQ